MGWAAAIGMNTMRVFLHDLPHLVAESDLVVALPRHFVAKHAGRYDVATRDGGLAWLLDALEVATRATRPRKS